MSDDVWHDLNDPASFESWQFDAISDDGREGLAITFYDNYVLSPRFHGTLADGATAVPGQRYPAVQAAYSIDGNVVVDTISEFDQSALTASAQHPECSIAGCSFGYGQAQYGVGFSLRLDLNIGSGQRLLAELEWLLVESDLEPAISDRSSDATWNLVAPRADVTGKLRILTGRRVSRVINFRGTGYHDHILSRHVHYRDLNSRMWGRAHFTDCTLVFDRHGGARDHSTPGRFFIIRDGRIEDKRAACQALDPKRDRWGLVIPERIWFRSDDGIMVRIKPVRTISSGIYETRMLGEVQLGLKDRRDRIAMGIIEFVNPQRLRSGLFRWVGGLGIRRAEDHHGSEA